MDQIKVISIEHILEGRRMREAEENRADDAFDGYRVTVNFTLNEGSPITTTMIISDATDKDDAYRKAKEQLTNNLKVLLTNAEKIDGKIIR